MPESKWFLMMPNTDHSTIAGILQEIPDMGTFLLYTLSRTPMPSATWSISKETGDITANVIYPSSGNATLHSATMWFAKTCTKGATGLRRDFRYSSLDDPCECGLLTDGTCMNKEAFSWESKVLSLQADGSYVAHMDADPSGAWTGFFIDFTFEKHEREGLGNWPVNIPGSIDFTTEVSIWPDSFPYEECYGEGCYGTLL